MQNKIKSFVIYEHQPNEYILTHSHDSNEMVFYECGNGFIHINDQRISYKENSMMICKPHVLHNETNLSYTKVYIIAFESDLEFENMLIDFSNEDAEEVRGLFNKLKEEYYSQKFMYEDRMASIFNLILILALRNSNVKITKRTDNIYVEYAKDYIRENCFSEIDYDLLAKQVNYSTERFRHLFKEVTGVSLSTYLFNVKITKIKDYLINSNLTIQEIADLTNFKSSSNLVQFFTEKVGISPNKFRVRSRSEISKKLGVLSLNPEDKTKYNIILDTDLGGDCDDVGALALLNMFHNQKRISISGITYTTSSKYGPKAIDIVNNYFGNKFDIGKTNRKNFYEGPQYEKYVVDLVNNLKTDFNENEVKDAVRLLREKLVQSDDKTTKIVAIGQLNNISDLLDSKADDISPLNGIDLVKQKVKAIYIMGGMFADSYLSEKEPNRVIVPEYNIVCDIKSAQNVTLKSPVDLIFLDFCIGEKVKVFGPLVSKGDLNNPITLSYTKFCGGARESWDPLTVWFAVNGVDSLLYLSQPGKVEISDDGITILKTDKEYNEPNHYFIKSSKNPDEISSDFDNFVNNYFRGA